MVLSTLGLYLKEQQSEATLCKILLHCGCRKYLHQHSHPGRALSFLESFCRLDASLWYAQEGHAALVFFGRFPQLPSTGNEWGYPHRWELPKQEIGVTGVLETLPHQHWPLHSQNTGTSFWKKIKSATLRGKKLNFVYWTEIFCKRNWSL